MFGFKKDIYLILSSLLVLQKRCPWLHRSIAQGLWFRFNMYRYHCKLHMCTCMSQYNHGDRHTSGYGCKLSPTIHKIIVILPSKSYQWLCGVSCIYLLVNLILGIVMDDYSWCLFSLLWIPHHNTHHYGAPPGLGKEDEKKVFQAKKNHHLSVYSSVRHPPRYWIMRVSEKRKWCNKTQPSKQETIPACMERNGHQMRKEWE